MSPDKANRAIDQSTRDSIARVTAGGRPAIRRRLVELQKEWSVDRALVLNFSVLVLAQLIAARRDRRWLWGPLLQTPFLIMHTTMGWCPPVLWFRPLGFRTRFEIQAEREALLEQLKQRKSDTEETSAHDTECEESSDRLLLPRGDELEDVVAGCERPTDEVHGYRGRAVGQEGGRRAERDG
jgi:hypothetical protein